MKRTHNQTPRVMKRPQYKIRLTLLLLMSMLAIEGQETKLERANKKYDNLAYIDAVSIYEKVANSGYKSEELFKKLGNSYYFNARYAEASQWYGELFAHNANIGEAIYYLRYSQSLKATGQDEASKRYYDTYIEKTGQGNANRNAVDYLSRIEENSNRYQIQATDINTEGIDFGGAFLEEDRVVFASTRDTVSVFKRRSAWDGLSFMDLYEASRGEDGSLSDPKALKGDVNTRYHESSAVFTKDGQTMYFTRNNTTPKRGQKKKEVQQLKIYRAKLKEGKWSDVEDLSINGETYSTAHPALSPDESTLYFVSDMPQSIGQTDLYKVRINSDGSLGRVENLGEAINTRGRESFPYMTKDGELYFSSDGHYGLGGYDVFYAELEGDKVVGEVLNVGKPVNSAQDDVGFVIDKNKRGYISSNRTGGSGYDDIYSFIETEDIKKLTKRKIEGVVTDKDTGAPLSNAEVVIVDQDNNEVARRTTGSDGRFEEIEVVKQAPYIVKVTRPDYEGSDAFVPRGRADEEVSIALKPIPRIDTLGDTINGDNNKEIDIAPLLNIIIHFDLDQSYIRPDAEVELEKLVAALHKYPELRIDIRSHTDSRASDGYNRSLSERRAQSTLNYLVNRGISKSRLTAKGYGETRLLNECSNGVKCSDVKHEENRRSEFIIIRE